MESPNSHEVKFILTLDDVIAFNRHFLKTSSTVRKRRLQGYLWWGLGGLVVGLISRAWGLAIIFALAGVLIWWLCQVYNQKWGIKRLVRELYDENPRSEVNRTHAIIIKEDGLEWIIEGLSDSTNKWFGILKAELTESHIFIYTGSNAANIVPKRAFADEASFKEFHVRLQRHLDEFKRRSQT